MRDAMFAAPLGDDVFGDDPSVNALQERIAALLGKEAALFMPTGTQSNLAALMSHCQRGDEYLVGQMAHTYRWEGGGAAVLGSIQPQPIAHQADGSLALADIEASIKPDDAHFARTRLLCLENTFGGQPMAMGYLRDATALARRHGLATHLDGARAVQRRRGAGRGQRQRSVRRGARHRRPVRQRLGVLQQGPGRAGGLGAGRLARARSRARNACARWPAAACARPACWRPRRRTRSSTTSRGWPTTTPTRAAWPRAWPASTASRSRRRPATSCSSTSRPRWCRRARRRGGAASTTRWSTQLRSRGVLCTGLYKLRFVTHLDVDAAGVDRAIAEIRRAVGASN